MMNEKLYNVLIWIFRILVPAIGTLYGTISTIVGWPYGKEVASICAAITVFGNAILMVDSDKFFENKEIVDKSEE